MAFCKFCNKWITQPEGKRKKEFCNNTCRSNFWYGKNKKGKEIKVMPPQKQYDAPKLTDNQIKDEPLNFDKLRQQIVPNPSMTYKTVPQYMALKREIDNEADYLKFCADVDSNPMLKPREKDFCKTANPSQL